MFMRQIKRVLDARRPTIYIIPDSGTTKLELNSGAHIRNECLGFNVWMGISALGRFSFGLISMKSLPVARQGSGITGSEITIWTCFGFLLCTAG